ncbi:MAG: hypothetical protein EOO41_04240 [Methanobacteriota archaeon]|nr:MAG: hypothetical protein EOO41_04240 [Euryarchaeota archaeon]
MCAAALQRHSGAADTPLHITASVASSSGSSSGIPTRARAPVSLPASAAVPTSSQQDESVAAALHIPVEPSSVREAIEAAARRWRSETHQDACFATAYENAVLGTGAGCDTLDESGKRSLSFALTVCHLRLSGRSGAWRACDASAQPAARDLPSVDSSTAAGRERSADTAAHTPQSSGAWRACVKNMTDAEFGVFSLYTTHLDNLCYFLEARSWRARIDDGVRALSHSMHAATTVSLQCTEARAAADTTSCSVAPVLGATQREALHARPPPLLIVCRHYKMSCPRQTRCDTQTRRRWRAVALHCPTRRMRSQRTLPFRVD